MSDPKTDEKPGCINCPHFVLTGNPNPTSGECHAEPPKVFPIGPGQTMGVFPPVDSRTWCGRHPARSRFLAGDFFAKGLQ